MIVNSPVSKDIMLFEHISVGNQSVQGDWDSFEWLSVSAGTGPNDPRMSREESERWLRAIDSHTPKLELQADGSSETSGKGARKSTKILLTCSRLQHLRGLDHTDPLQNE